MAEQSQPFKKKQHFLELIKGVPREKILFFPIDVSKDFHVSLFHNIDCQPLTDYFAFSASRVGFESFANRIKQVLVQREPQVVIVGMEPTNVYYEGLLHQLRERYASSATVRFELGIVDPAAVKLNREQHSLRFQKSDQIDTAAIGELLTRGLYTPAHFAAPLALQIRELSRAINDYERDQWRLWNRLLVTVERVFPNLLIDYGEEKPIVKAASRSVLVDDLLHVSPDPYRILELSAKELITLFHGQGRRLGPKYAAHIKQAAARALLLPPSIHAIHQQTLQTQLQTLGFLKDQIARLSQQMLALLPQTPARHLAEMAGNSADLTLDLIAAMGDWQRFHSIQQIWAAAGLEPTKDQSGSCQAKAHISKDGSARLRQAIYKMACSVVWHEPTFGIPCFERLLAGAGFVHTILHVGRKLTNTALAILKSDRPFEPPLADYPAAKGQLLQLQQRYQQQKKQKKRGSKTFSKQK